MTLVPGNIVPRVRLKAEIYRKKRVMLFMPKLTKIEVEPLHFASKGRNPDELELCPLF